MSPAHRPLRKQFIPGIITSRGCCYAGCKGVVIGPIKDAVTITHGPIGCGDYSWETRRNKLNKLQEAVTFARDAGASVTVGAEDASRADFNFLVKYACLARELGAERLRYADTVGVLHPFNSYNKVQRLIRESGISIDFHAHNDFGMAIANTLAGAQAGAEFISTTVLGLGERAGNCSLETIVSVLDQFLPTSVAANQNALNDLTQYVTSVTK